MEYGVVELGFIFFFFFQAEDGIRDLIVTGVQTCALPILRESRATAFPARAQKRRPGAAARRVRPARSGRARRRRARRETRKWRAAERGAPAGGGVPSGPPGWRRGAGGCRAGAAECHAPPPHPS